VLYYSNGGPGPATKLIRIDAPGDGDFHAWYHAQGWRWRAADVSETSDGWTKYEIAQGEVTQTGEYGMIDASEVERVQQEIRNRPSYVLRADQ
jgi:hypothetical protein